MKHAVLVCLLFPNDFWAIDRTLTSFDDPEFPRLNWNNGCHMIDLRMAESGTSSFNVLFVIKAPL